MKLKTTGSHVTETVTQKVRSDQEKQRKNFKYTRQDSNLQPSVPKTDALSSCATGAKGERIVYSASWVGNPNFSPKHSANADNGNEDF